MKKNTWLYILCILAVPQLAFASVRNDGENSSDDEALKHQHRRSTQTKDSSDPYQDKMKRTKKRENLATGHYDARFITFGTHFFVRNATTYELRAESSDVRAAKVYRKDPNADSVRTSSQLLITEDDLSLGASVTTSIKTTTLRKNESKQTYIQYDKNTVKQKGCAFPVDAQNEKGDANYDGGHLTDHKFSAEGSHTDPFNYVPQHHAYNRWIKESIVKQRTGKAAPSNIEGYVEIPLYTSNPPKIKVSGEKRYDAIPIGIILVTLKNQVIEDAYYFPNNQYNYRTLQGRLKLPRFSGSKIAPYFKLKRDLHPLLMPAIIYDGRHNNTLHTQQVRSEKKKVDVVDALVEGMSVLSLEDEEATIGTLASNTLFQKNVDLTNILDLSKQQVRHLNKGQPNPKALIHSFNVLGQFLIEYAMGNALKSEVLMPTSRIMFLNIMIDFFDNFHQFEGASLKALDYVHTTFLDAFEESLTELERQKEKMNLRDLLYFANLYEKLSTESMNAAVVNGYGIGDDFMDVQCNLFKFIEILKTLSVLVEKQDPTPDQMQNLTEVFSGAQHNLSYVLTIWGGSDMPEELKSEFRPIKQFLKSMKPRVLTWDKGVNKRSGTYQNSPNSQVSFRGENGMNKYVLGSNSSLVYPNSESDESAGSEEDESDGE
ncbi:MAG: hypothetical protein K2X53_02730 [Alphaproteobacteria bacterium]|nr:hypothetical protein [Alphaproteobacteria bacterium]